jgi:tryptophan 2,3-dioxygenase
MEGDGRLPSDVIREQIAREVLRNPRLAAALAEAHERVARTEEETAVTYDSLAAMGGPRSDEIRDRAEQARTAAALARECAAWARSLANKDDPSGES